MSRTKLFLENILVYGGIQAINKLFPLLFLPFIINLIKGPEEFGKFDMFSIFVSLGSTIATLGVFDAGFRENFDRNNNYKTEVITSTITVIMALASAFIILLCLIFKDFISLGVWKSSSYSIYVYISAITILLQSLQTVGIMPLRLKNDRKKYSFYLLGNSVLYYFFTILFLKIYPFGISLMYATALSSFILVINLFLVNRQYFNIKLFSWDLTQTLLKIGLPLVPVFLSFWLLQSISRLQISNNLGLTAQGVYSLGYRVASISMLVQVAYTTGFSFFSFSTMNYSDQVANRTKLLKYLVLVSILFSSFILFFQKLIFITFFPAKYLEALKVFPFLLFLPLLFIMYQTITNQFTIAKKTYITSIILFVGVLITYFLNVFLIRNYGITGAAFGTFLGYFSILVISYLIALKLQLLINDIMVLTLFLLMVLEFLLIFLNIISIYYIAAFTILVILLFYMQILVEVFNKTKSIIKAS